MPSIHVIAYGFPPATEAGGKSLVKLIYPLHRDADFKLKITTADPVMFAAHDYSLAGYVRDFDLNYVRWSGQRLYELLNRLCKWHTDDYGLFARKCREILLRGKVDDLYFLRGQYFSTFLLAPFIRQQLKRPVVLYFSDPWLQNPYLGWTPRLKKRMARLEAMALESASGVIFTNMQAQNATLSHYPHLRLRSLVLPHVYLETLYQRRDGRREDKIRLTFAGNFYGDRQPTALFNAIAELKRVKHPLMSTFRFQLIGPDKSLYRRQVQALNLEPEIDFLGSRSYLETLNYLQASDVLVNIDAPSEVSLFLPSKLIDYMGCKLPIWTLSPPGAAATLVAEYGGLVSSPTDLRAIKDDLLLCLERATTQSWNLNVAFAEQFESQKNYPKLKSFLQAILGLCPSH